MYELLVYVYGIGFFKIGELDVWVLLFWILIVNDGCIEEVRNFVKLFEVVFVCDVFEND